MEVDNIQTPFYVADFELFIQNEKIDSTHMSNILHYLEVPRLFSIPLVNKTQIL